MPENENKYISYGQTKTKPKSTLCLEITSTVDLNYIKKNCLGIAFFIRNLSRALTEEIPESGRAPSRHLFFAHKKAIGRNDEKAAEFGGL